MNKKIISVTSAALLTLALLALAQGVFTPPALGGFGGSLTSLVLLVLDIVWIAFVAVAIIFFVIAGISFLTAQGDPGKVATARNAVIFGAIGIVVGVIAFSVVTILRGTLGV